MLRSVVPGGDGGRVSDVLMPVYLQMLFVRLPQLSPHEFFRLINEHVLFGLSMEGFDLGSRVYDRLSISFEEEERVEMVREMLKSLETGVEILGSSFEVLGRDAVPTVENWLKEYRASAPASQGRTSFSEINFLNKNINVQKLTQVQRGLLLKLLSFYDGFANALHEYDSAPELYVEDNPELELALINPTPDEWDALSVDRPGAVSLSHVQNGTVASEEGRRGDVSASNLLLDAAVKRAVPEVGVVAPTDFVHGEDTPDAHKIPNVQGVLVQVPLGASERTGLEVMQEADSNIASTVAVAQTERSTTAQEVVSPTPQSTVDAVGATTLETLKVQAQAKQEQMQAEIEEKLAKLKRKS